jgi:hypothetical protein
MAAIEPPTQRTWLERWSPIGGLLFIAGLIVVFAATGDSGDTIAEVIDYAEDESGWIDFTGAFALASLLLVGWFVGGLYARLRRFGAAVESVLALVGGVAFTLLFFLALTIWTAPVSELDGEDDAALQQLHAAEYLSIEDIGWITLGGAGVGAGLMIIASSLAALRSRAAPSWAGWVGVALGVIALATVAFFGIFAWMLWILVASVAMLVRRSETPAAAPRA